MVVSFDTKRSLVLRVMQSGFVLYVGMVILFLPILFNKNVRRSPHKVLNRLMPEYSTFVRYKEGDVPDQLSIRQAIYYFRTVNHYFPGRPDTAGMLGYFYFADGNLAQAARWYREANRIHKDFFWYHYNLALIYFQQKKYAAAVEELKIAVAQTPDTAIKFMNFSRIYRPFALIEGNFNEMAVESLRHGYRNAYILLAQSLILSKRFEEATHVSRYANQLDLGDDDGLLSYYAGVGHHFSGEFPEAVEMLQKAIKVNPQNPEAYFYLAQSVEKLGQVDLSRNLFLKAREIGTKNGTILPDPKTWRVQMY